MAVRTQTDIALEIFGRSIRRTSVFFAILSSTIGKDRPPVPWLEWPCGYTSGDGFIHADETISLVCASSPEERALAGPHERRLFFGRKTHWCVDDNAKGNYNKRPCRCGRSSLARLFSRADRGHGPSVFTLLSDGLARLRPLEGATS
jgi:hypothetical protein